MKGPHVAIVGAGFTGLLCALHLLEASASLRVSLIERDEVFGRGLAFGKADPEHLLNVRASNMSAFADRPHHFVEWLRTGAAGVEGSDFVSRNLFGAYLQTLLRNVVVGDAAPGRLTIVADEVVGIAEDGKALRLAMGRTLAVDLVVLAMGNLPPHSPVAEKEAVRSHEGWIPDPWAKDAFAHVKPTDRIVLLGTGLTAADVILKLARQHQTGPVTALSRRGLRSRHHLDGVTPVIDHAVPAQPALSQLVHLVRERARREGWRRAVDGLRPHTQRLWREATPDQQRRFLRHLRPWWDVHRHRLAPVAAEKIDRMAAAGGVAFKAGQVEGIDRLDDHLVIRWRPRSSTKSTATECDVVVNCTGPAGDVGSTKDALLSGLVAKGFARPDPCGLGLDVDADCRVIDTNGNAHPSIYALGPLSRGAFWEVVAVPDIRVQVASVAHNIAGRFEPALSRSSQGAPSSSL